MISSEPVLAAAEKVAEDIIEAYRRPSITFKEWQQLWGPADPWHEFTKACRAERKSMLGRLRFLDNRYCEDWFSRGSLCGFLR